MVGVTGEPGALLVAGSTREASPIGAPWRALVLRVDGLGNPQWQRTWSQGDGARIAGLAGVSDGFVGLADAVTGLDDDTTLLRADHYGHTDCAAAGGCVDKGLGCHDANACTADTCTADKGCVHTPLADGSPCGGAQTCASGVCGP